jgi:hypothetical protein
LRTPDLLILAAGMGSRYGGLKQLEPFGPAGETIMDYSVYDALRCGYGRVVFVIRRDFAERFEREVTPRFKGRIPVVAVFQDLASLPGGHRPPEGRSKPWGTVQAVLAARQACPGPFVMINADDFYGRASYQAMADYFRSLPENAAGRYAMAGYTLRSTLSDHGTVTRGICRCDSQGRLLQMDETRGIARKGSAAHAPGPDGTVLEFSGSELVSMNFFGFTPDLFSHLEGQFSAFLDQRGGELNSELLIPQAMDTLLKQGKASVQVLQGSPYWFGVTNPEDKHLVIADILDLVHKGEYPEKLFA